MIFDLNEGVDALSFDSYTGRSRASILENVAGIEPVADNISLASMSVGVCIESTYNRFMEYTALSELKAVDESGTFMIYERFEGAKERIKDWFDKAKETFKKIWQYVKGFFMKAFKILESLFGTNHKFLKDNRDLLSTGIKAGTLGKITFSGYKYTISEGVNDAVYKAIVVKPFERLSGESYINSLLDTPDAWKAGSDITFKDISGSDKYRDTNALRTEILNDLTITDEPLKSFLHGDKTETDLRDHIFKAFRSGKSSKLEIKGSQAYSSADELIKAIEDKNSSIKSVNQDYKDAKEDIDKIIDNLGDFESFALKAATYKHGADGKTTDQKRGGYSDKHSEAVMRYAKLVSEIMKLFTRAQSIKHSEHLKAIKGNSDQARAVARQLIIHGTKMKDLGKRGKFVESTIFEDTFDDDDDDFSTYDDDAGSFLDDNDDLFSSVF